MYPFEVWDERTGRVEFYHNKWREYRNELFRQYPIMDEHRRIELGLYFPSDRLEDVRVHNWNPHHEAGNTHLSVYDCFYDSSAWSTIFEVYPLHDRHHPEAVTLFIEDGHQDPWGEPIRIMSTSADIGNDSSHRFAYFRGKYWKIFGWSSHTAPFYWEQIWREIRDRGNRIRQDIQPTAYINPLLLERWSIGPIGSPPAEQQQLPSYISICDFENT